jgi:hypothetical protein
MTVYALPTDNVKQKTAISAKNPWGIRKIDGQYQVNPDRGL